VKTDRFKVGQVGRELLKSFLPNVQAASEILGLTVKSMQVDTGAGLPSGGLNPGEKEDEFIPIYNQASGASGGGQFGTTPTDELPTGAIIGGAAGVVVLGTLAAILLWYRRRQARQFHNDMAAVKAKQVEDNDPEYEKVGVSGQDVNEKPIASASESNEKPITSASEDVGHNNEIEKLGEGAAQTLEGDVVTDKFGENKASTPRSPKADVPENGSKPITPKNDVPDKAGTPRTPQGGLQGDVTDVPQEDAEDSEVNISTEPNVEEKDRL